MTIAFKPSEITRFLSGFYHHGFGPSGVIFCEFFTFAAMACAGTYSGGTGTAADPYKISTVADWQELIATSADYGENFILVNDIDFVGTHLMPVATFTGVFNGNSHVLRNIVIDLPTADDVGLFGTLDRGEIRDLGVDNTSVVGRECVGGLCGYISGGLITGCFASGTITGGDVSKNLGGLCGVNGPDGQILYCFSTANVHGGSSSSAVGGLCGANSSGIRHDTPYTDGSCTIGSCFATGDVSGGSQVGGLCGLNFSKWCLDCGIGWIHDSYATGVVSGQIYVGGLCGKNVGEIMSAPVTRCYSIGSVNGVTDVGGLVGRSLYIPWEGWEDAPEFIQYSFWDIQTSDQTSSFGGVGKTTDQMKTLGTYQNATWGTHGWVMRNGMDYPHLDWEGTAGDPIPNPLPVPLLGGGTLEDPYRVNTVEEFALLGEYVTALDKYFILMADLDLSGILLSPIGGTCPLGDFGSFSGVFDGNGHALRNAVIHQAEWDYTGLFGRLAKSGQVRNLHVENVEIVGTGYVGGLAGKNEGRIGGCSISGTVNGTWSVGGLAGENERGTITACTASSSVSATEGTLGGLVGYNFRGTIDSCSASGSVSGRNNAGGLAGNNDAGAISACYSSGAVNGNTELGGLAGNNYEGTISDCYASGAVRGEGHVGGLIGTNSYGRVIHCYSTGKPTGSYSIGGFCGWKGTGTVEDRGNFWDTLTSQMTTSAMGVGKTTAEMKTLSTFTSVGWDFVGETANGTEDVWRMCADGISYPRLSWEFSQSGDMDCPDGVGLEDLVYLAKRWLANTPETARAADGNGDGRVDLSDFEILASNWMRE